MVVNMTYAGRIYQNPHDKREIWMNVGWFGYEYKEENAQVYPDYDDKLAQYISSQTFNDLIQLLRENLQDKPCIDGGCAQLICCCTCGICFWPLLYVKSKYKSCKESMINAFKKQSISKELEVFLRFVEETEPLRATSSPWIDSTGQTLILLNYDQDSKKISGPGGPPPGLNMVFKLPGDIQWPSPAAANIPPLPPPQYPPSQANIAPYPPPPNVPQYPPPPQGNVAPYPPPPNVPQYPPPPQGNVPQYPPPPNVPQYPPPPQGNVAPYPPALGNIRPPALVDAPPPYPPPPQGNYGSMNMATMEPKYCGGCGSRIIGNKFCTSCGAQN